MAKTELKRTESGEIKVIGQLLLDEVMPLLKSSKAYFNEEGSALVFDMTEVAQSDSAGVALLVEWMAMAKLSGQAISFKALPKQMLDIAQVSGVDKLLPLEF